MKPADHDPEFRKFFNEYLDQHPDASLVEVMDQWFLKTVDKYIDRLRPELGGSKP